MDGNGVSVTEPAAFGLVENPELQWSEASAKRRVVPEERHHALVCIAKHGIDAIAPAFAEVAHPVARIGLKHQSGVTRIQRIHVGTACEVSDAQLLQSVLEGLLQLRQGHPTRVLLQEGFRNIERLHDTQSL